MSVCMCVSERKTETLRERNKRERKHVVVDKDVLRVDSLYVESAIACEKVALDGKGCHTQSLFTIVFCCMSS